MRREGRQHGMIRTFPINLSGNSRRRRSPANNEIIIGTAAGLFTKAPSKPTNHSKFTGPMCRDCHIHPACKFKPKTKGAHKDKGRSTDRVMSGASVSLVLDYLDDDLDYT